MQKVSLEFKYVFEEMDEVQKYYSSYSLLIWKDGNEFNKVNFLGNRKKKAHSVIGFKISTIYCLKEKFNISKANIKVFIGNC